MGYFDEVGHRAFRRVPCRLILALCCLVSPLRWNPGPTSEPGGFPVRIDSDGPNLSIIFYFILQHHLLVKSAEMGSASFLNPEGDL